MNRKALSHLESVVISIIILTISSCSFPSYQYVFETPPVLNFENGTWLVNRIQADIPWTAKNALDRNMTKELQKLGGDSVQFIDGVNFPYLTPDQFKFAPSENTFTLLQSTSGFDFLINTKAIKLRDELNSFRTKGTNRFQKSKSELIIVIYEIKTGQKIYSQRVIASESLDENDDRFTFSDSALSLISKVQKKALKNIKKRAVRNR